MYADARSAITTLKQANDLCEEIGHPNLGVAVDVYHLWWDPELEAQITRCGKMKKIFAFHVCDWKTPTTDFLNDRGLMGEGCINIPKIRGWVENAGFGDLIEVEIFSSIYWAQDQDEFLARLTAAFKEHV
jgi:sugar phosphate isomerase/epimerase